MVFTVNSNNDFEKCVVGKECSLTDNMRAAQDIRQAYISNGEAVKIVRELSQKQRRPMTKVVNDAISMYYESQR